jgi:hypothetical protein
MKTQSADTHPDVERMLIHLIRTAPMSKRFRLIQSLTQGAFWSNIHAWRQRHPNVSEHDVALQVVSHSYGPLLAEQVREAFIQHHDWSLQPIDLLTVMLPVLQAFDELNLFWYLGGSIASSLHGMQQMAQDIDLVVNLHSQNLPSLLPLLKQHYAFDDNSFQEAVAQHTACSLIHLDTLMKVDLIMARQGAFDIALQPRIASYHLDDRYPSLPLASAVEMILVKLHCYSQDLLSRNDGMRDDAEWNDIVGMLKIQEPTLERDFLEEWARNLKIAEVLWQALVDAGAEEVQAA